VQTYIDHVRAVVDAVGDKMAIGVDAKVKRIINQ
jgi:hypothetical protein